MIRIYKLTTGKNPHYQHYRVKSRKGYKKVSIYNGKTVWAKIKKGVGIDFIPPEPPIEDKNTKVTLFFKTDYGITGHRIWFDVWVSRIFAPNQLKRIPNWKEQTKQYIIDKIVGWGFNALEGVILGTEITETKESTFSNADRQEEQFEYSHDDKTWLKII